jgi:carbonic anhydrase
MADDINLRLRTGNRKYIEYVDKGRLSETAEKGQHPYAIVVCCSDSRVIPERIFNASIGDLFVIRVAGNVLGRHQLGSIEYAVSHLNCRHIIVLGHTGCGAVEAAIKGGEGGFIKDITDEIIEAIGSEHDPDKACCLNVEHTLERLKKEFAGHPDKVDMIIEGAIYDIRSGEVSWL